MKNHKRFKELIQGYLDNALSSKERQDLKNHLKSCEECSEELKRRTELLEKLRSTKEEIQCPDHLIGNILKETTRKESPTIIGGFKIRWEYVAVSAAAILIVISTVLLNIEDNNTILTIKEEEKIQKQEPLKKGTTPISDTSLKKEKTEVAKEKKAHLKSGSEGEKAPAVKVPEAYSPGKQESFAAADKAPEEISGISRKATPPPSVDFETSRARGIESASSYSEGISCGRAMSKENFKETRFVFPEEGSVVGKDFEIVLIMENPEETIEISLDGKIIKNYTKEKDSNIIFIGSDSIFPLEEGFHYLSLKTKEEKSITFYKEG